MGFMDQDVFAVVFGCMFALKLSALYWLLLRAPWLCVLVLGFMLGLCLHKCWRMTDELDGLWEDKKELEKQVVALRTTIDHMARARLEEEVDRRRWVHDHRVGRRAARSESCMSL